jgi:predicted nucleic acid-binding protein
MKILFDTNVLLDIALARKPFVKASMKAWTMVSTGLDKPMIAPHSLATFYYMVRQAHGNPRAHEAVRDLLETGSVAAFDEQAASTALALEFSDFEDAMVAAVAVSAEAEWILTRNIRDFKKSPVPCQTPEAFVSMFS